MKDLYTFDFTPESALQTYETIRHTYTAFFNEFKIPYLTAKAASGDIGGDLSHEYHFPTSKGEDNIISCSSCDYIANEELAESRATRMQRSHSFSPSDLLMSDDNMARVGNFPTRKRDEMKEWLGISQDRSTLFRAFFPTAVQVNEVSGKKTRETQINPYMIKAIFPELDLSVEDPLSIFTKHHQSENLTAAKSSKEPQVLQIFDFRSAWPVDNMLPPIGLEGLEAPIRSFVNPKPDEFLDLVRIENSDPCPNCNEGALRVQNAVELGHTFYLGTRYSAPLDATIATDPSQKDAIIEGSNSTLPTTTSNRIPLQMGCHGIGVSRLIAAVADFLADSKGLNWPRVMAPFEAVIVPTKGQDSGATEVYDILAPDPTSHYVDAIIDDRKRDFGWKLKDADMIGYPVIVVVGRNWGEERMCEVQCRRLEGYKELVPAKELKRTIESLLQHL
ncbi:hypothetical protein MMC28_000722 [Mycoblastus sanguinarius]|nr:hypothetical protein [Mycoblastus sanguinarius]